MGRCLFIADLHLSPQRPATSTAFAQFLAGPASGAPLYILGDLFDYWIGDDVRSPFTDNIIEALARHSATGAPLYLLHGNRDFLLGERFAASTGATLLDDTVIDLFGIPTLLTHGDALCSEDRDYQAFRNEVRSPAWQQEFLALTPQEREQRARSLRALSREQSALKAAEITDVTQATVDAALDQHGVGRLIHGHTHRPGVHRWEHGGALRERHVLGEWDATGCYLNATSKSLELRYFDIEQ